MNLKALQYALTDSNSFTPTLGLVAITAAVTWFGGTVAGVVFAMVAACLIGTLYVTGYRSFRVVQVHNASAAVDNWVAGADSDEERAARRRRVNGFSAEGAADHLGLAVSEPLVNIDGSPMTPGGVADINGNLYGAVPVEGVHHTAGGWVGVDDAYGGVNGRD